MKLTVTQRNPAQEQKVYMPILTSTFLLIYWFISRNHGPQLITMSLSILQQYTSLSQSISLNIIDRYSLLYTTQKQAAFPSIPTCTRVLCLIGSLWDFLMEKMFWWVYTTLHTVNINSFHSTKPTSTTTSDHYKIIYISCRKAAPIKCLICLNLS